MRKIYLFLILYYCIFHLCIFILALCSTCLTKPCLRSTQIYTDRNQHPHSVYSVFKITLNAIFILFYLFIYIYVCKFIPFFHSSQVQYLLYGFSDISNIIWLNFEQIAFLVIYTLLKSLTCS